MKKLLLLSMIGMVSSNINAQEAKSLSVVRTDAGYTKQKPQVDARMEAAYKQIAAQKAARNAASTSANKGTASGQRVYNWSDYLKNVKTMTVTSPYMWHDGKGMGVYSSGTGLIVDTISFASYGIILAPFYKEFNDDGVADYVGKIALNQQSGYTVDSIVTYGNYGRNSTKTGVVDTMIISLAYGPNSGGTASSIRSVYYVGANTKANFGVDTLRCTQLAYNAAQNTAMKTGTGADVITKRIYLTAADSNRTRFAVAVGQAVPGGNFVGATVSFKTGDAAYVPYTDTVFAGSANPNTPFKFGMVRPALYEETTGQFPTYTAGNQNTSQMKFLPEDANYKDEYIPGWAFTSGDFTLEWPDIDFVVSSSNAIGFVGVNKINLLNTKANAYPNPANNEVKIAFNQSAAANTTVSISNTVGQVISTQNLGNVATGEATFSTANLSNGLYFYTIEANGQRTTNRFVVAH